MYIISKSNNRNFVLGGAFDTRKDLHSARERAHFLAKLDGENRFVFEVTLSPVATAKVTREVQIIDHTRQE